MKYLTRFPENVNAGQDLSSYSWKKLLLQEYPYVQELYHCLNPHTYSVLYLSAKAGTVLIQYIFSYKFFIKYLDRDFSPAY